ncbi:MAG: hypothetical protein ABI583_14055 [Betaproteobacteria bacterium]
MRRHLKLGLKYLAVVAISCLLAFVISHRAIADTAPSATFDFSAAGAYKVDLSLATWRDAVRRRDIPVKLYFPTTSSTAKPAPSFPVILFSHGLGGSREGGKRWAEHWASHGYVVIALQHVGSDESLWKGAPLREIASKMKAGMTLANLTLRIEDIHFVIDEIIRRTEAHETAFVNADPKRIGMSGHSFGAQTTLAVAGQKSPFDIAIKGLDSRIGAAIAFSPNARNQNALARQFGEIKLPFFFITGTADGSILGDGTRPEQRRLPFEYMSAGQKYLAVFDAGDHMVFGGHGFGPRRPETARDKEIQLDVMAGTLAFWNATLKQDALARHWLEKGGFEARLDANDIFAAK